MNEKELLPVPGAPVFNTAQVLRYLASGRNALPFMAFRSAAGGRIFIGSADHAHVLRDRADTAAFSRAVDARAAAGATLFGYTSYECHFDTGRTSGDWPLAVLCEAQTVLAIDGDTCREVGSTRLGTALAGLVDTPAAVPATTLAGIRDHDGNWPAFRDKLRRIRDWAQADLGKHRRLTISRTIHIDADIDAVATFLAYAPTDLLRAFLFRWDTCQVLGQSPELMVDGSTRKFSTYKLSGTAPRSPDALADDALLHDMLESRKLQDEHEGSIVSIENRLRTVGQVTRSAKFIQTLPELRHFVTRLDVSNEHGPGLSQVLSAASPSGAYPLAEALALLSQLETRPRGPYYGLIGYASGTEQLEFSQVLRSVFNSGRDGWYTRVGACTTEDSVPQLELEETCTKLRNISCCMVPAGGSADQSR